MNRRRRNGFVTTFALFMFALVAVALAGLTARVGTAARHAARAREQAQVEELLLAGTELARLAKVGAEEDVVLPKGLAAEGTTLKVITRAGRAQVQARVGRTRQFETVETSPAPPQ